MHCRILVITLQHYSPQAYSNKSKQFIVRIYHLDIPSTYVVLNKIKDYLEQNTCTKSAPTFKALIAAK